MTWLELLWVSGQLIRQSDGRRPRDRGFIHSRNKDGIAFTFSIIISTISNVAERNCDLAQFCVFVRAEM
jgi:hypothetical protein